MGLSWLMVSIVFLLLPNKLLSQSASDTTVFNYTRFSEDDPSLILQGDAYIYPWAIFPQLTATDDSIYPGIPLPNRAGRVVYSPPIRLWDKAGRRQANFQTRFTCYILKTMSVDMADGISFFMAPVNTTIPAGSTGGNMGIYGSSGSSPTPLFAVELDIFSNTWDPNYPHVGININSRNSVAVDRLYLRTNVNWHWVDVRITYDARERLITAFASARSSSWPPLNPTVVEHVYDLKTLLPEWVQIGISASTGNPVVAYHDIRAWSFISFLVPDQVTDAADH